MEYITTTNLRTKSKQLVDALKKGAIISLIHRSKVIGKIQPFKEAGKLFDAAEFKRFVKDLKLPKTTPSQRDKIYRKHLLRKYGKGIS